MKTIKKTFKENIYKVTTINVETLELKTYQAVYDTNIKGRRLDKQINDDWLLDNHKLVKYEYIETATTTYELSVKDFKSNANIIKCDTSIEN